MPELKGIIRLSYEPTQFATDDVVVGLFDALMEGIAERDEMIVYAVFKDLEVVPTHIQATRDDSEDAG